MQPKSSSKFAKLFLIVALIMAVYPFNNQTAKVKAATEIIINKSRVSVASDFGSDKNITVNKDSVYTVIADPSDVNKPLEVNNLTIDEGGKVTHPQADGNGQYAIPDLYSLQWDGYFKGGNIAPFIDKYQNIDIKSLIGTTPVSAFCSSLPTTVIDTADNKTAWSTSVNIGTFLTATCFQVNSTHVYKIKIGPSDYNSASAANPIVLAAGIGIGTVPCNFVVGNGMQPQPATGYLGVVTRYSDCQLINGTQSAYKVVFGHNVSKSIFTDADATSAGLQATFTQNPSQGSNKLTPITKFDTNLQGGFFYGYDSAGMESLGISTKYAPASVNLKIDGILTINGSINVTGRGAPGGFDDKGLGQAAGNSGFGLASQAGCNSNDQQCFVNGGGGGHGGRGIQSVGGSSFEKAYADISGYKFPYDILSGPTQVGSGGGGGAWYENSSHGTWPHFDGQGGYGGGAVHIVANNIVISKNTGSGSIIANGTSGRQSACSNDGVCAQSGGGAGGSIWIETNNLDGSGPNTNQNMSVAGGGMSSINNYYGKPPTGAAQQPGTVYIKDINNVEWSCGTGTDPKKDCSDLINNYRGLAQLNLQTVGGTNGGGGGRIAITAVPPSTTSVSCIGTADTTDKTKAHFSATSSGTGDYSWTSSDGSPQSGTGSTFDVTYAKSGKYTVTVTQVQGGSSSSAECSVTIGTPVVSETTDLYDLLPSSLSVADITTTNPAATDNDGAQKEHWQLDPNDTSLQTYTLSVKIPTDFCTTNPGVLTLTNKAFVNYGDGQGNSLQFQATDLTTPVLCPIPISILGDIGSIVGSISNNKIKVVGPAVAIASGTASKFDGTVTSLSGYNYKKSITDITNKLSTLIKEAKPWTEYSDTSGLNPTNNPGGTTWVSNEPVVTLNSFYPGRGTLIVTSGDVNLTDGFKGTNNNISDAFGIIALNGDITLQKTDSATVGENINNIALFAPNGTVTLDFNSYQYLLSMSGIIVANKIVINNASDKGGTITFPGSFVKSPPPGFSDIVKLTTISEQAPE